MNEKTNENLKKSLNLIVLLSSHNFFWRGVEGEGGGSGDEEGGEERRSRRWREGDGEVGGGGQRPGWR